MSDPQQPVAVTGAWRVGDPVGHRRFVTVFERGLDLEIGGAFGAVTVAYETWGTLNPRRDNAVLVLHALTGDSHAAGDRDDAHPTPGWWDAVIGPGRAIDTDRYFVVAPNVFGGCQGTTGPSSPDANGSPYGSTFPTITVRDQVEVEIALADALGIDRFHAVVGGSMGGMRALEWAVMRPDRVARLVVIGVGAYATAEQIAIQTNQIRTIELDPAYDNGDYYDRKPGAGPWRGLSIARAAAQISYRSELEFAERFGRAAQDGEDPRLGGRYAIESYLEYHGEKLARRFDANSYVVLTVAMNHHDVGRDRGGIDRALDRITAETTVVGIDSDRLYPPRLQRELANLIPTARPLEIIHSPYGHDAFLVEYDQVSAILRGALQ